MQDELRKVLLRECNASLDNFQLSSIDLPNQFETAIDDTEVARQLIVTTKAQKENVAIELGTKIQQAQIQRDVVINEAKAKADADIQRATAAAQSLKEVAVQEASAYAGLKTGLGLTNQELLAYIEGQTISTYD
jgi:regulator of protease activity HflC (stomatin/prohibitin superfamily)